MSTYANHAIGRARAHALKVHERKLAKQEKIAATHEAAHHIIR